MPTSGTVGDSDLEAIFRIVADGRHDDLGEPLPWSMLTALKDLLHCDAVSFFDLDSDTQTSTFEQSLPIDTGGDGDDGCFWLHYWDCLACSHPDRSGDLRSVTKASDFYSRTDWHHQGMYRDYLQPLGVEHEIMLCLPGGPGRTLRLLFFRGPGSDFSERDRAILTLLRPHLYNAYLDSLTRREGTPDLTPRQWELMRLVHGGYSNAQIARRLFVSEGTVRKHLENIYNKLDVTSRLAAIQRAFPDPLHRLA